MAMIDCQSTPFDTVSSSNRTMRCRESPKTLKSAMKRAQVAPLSTRSARRSVTFEHNVDVREVPHLKDLPKEDLIETWYTSEDFDRIKKSLVITLRLMVAKKPIGNDQCTRGLEFRTPHGAKLRKKNKLDALTAVWNEQVAQWKDNKTDEDAISRVYREQTLNCLQAARKFGLSDEKVAQAYLGQDGDSSVSSFSSVESWTNKGVATNGNIEKIVVKQSCFPQAA
jgi:hypothetical protein